MNSETGSLYVGTHNHDSSMLRHRESVCEGIQHFKNSDGYATKSSDVINVHNHLHKSSRKTKRSDDENQIMICETKGGYTMRNSDQITEKNHNGRICESVLQQE